MTSDIFSAVVDRTEAFRAAKRAEIVESASPSFAFFLMNTLATVIASYGLFANSPAVVIGAMIVAMLLGPITGVALALVDSDRTLLKESLKTLALGTFGVMATAFLLGLLHRNLPLTDEIMARTAPNLMDMMIALAGGAAGAYATVSPRLSGAFIGVAIATALVPPLASSSILLSRGEYFLALNSFSLAFVNMVAIQLASSVVMWFMGLRAKHEDERHSIVEFLKRNSISLVILFALGVLLASNFKNLIRTQIYETKVRETLNAEMESYPGSFLANVRFDLVDERSRIGKVEHAANIALGKKGQEQSMIIRALVRGPNPLTAEDVQRIEDKLPHAPHQEKSELRIRFVQTSVTSRDGILFDTGKYESDD